jgi:hypothetical protein
MRETQMSDNAIGRYKPDPVLLRAKVKDPELRRRTQELFKSPRGLCDVNVVGAARSASPPPRAKTQTLSEAHTRLRELDREAEIALVKKLLGVPTPQVRFEIINRQEPSPPTSVAPTIITLKVDVEQRKVEVRKELGLAEDYRKNDEINLSQATILLRKFGLTANEDGVSFSFPNDYTEAQYRRVLGAIEYYAFCAGVKGDDARYKGGGELLETARARVLSK